MINNVESVTEVGLGGGLADKLKDDFSLLKGLELNGDQKTVLSVPQETMSITYLNNAHDLTLMKPDAALVDDQKPYSGLMMAGKWLREAFDVRNYWKAAERLGEDVAEVQWALNESQKPFDVGTFGKEVLKAGVRHIGSDSLQTMGNLLKMTGENFKNYQADEKSTWRKDVGDSLTRMGGVFKEYAEAVSNADILEPTVSDENVPPRFLELADTIGGGAAQVLSMGLMSRFMGATATYGFFTAGGAGEMFDEAFQKTGDVTEANQLAAANAGVTFAIDRWFNPLPKTIAKGARVTAGEIAKEAIGAPLREAGSEVLQQMLAENLVRKVGFDDTQNLFEGLIESALGAMAGSSVLVGAQGGMYAAEKSLDTARQKILAQGVKNAELEIAEQGMMSVLKNHPEAFQKVLDAHFRENIAAFEQASKQAKDASDRAKALEAAKGFPKVYDTLLARAQEAMGDEHKAKLAAGVLSAGAISLYQRNPDLTPQMMIERFLPQFKKLDYADFLSLTSPDAAVSYMFAGQHAKGANLALMSDAADLLKKNVDARDVWQRTGWHLGSDGKMRFEISDRDAKLKLWSPDKISEQAEMLLSKEMADLEDIKAQLAVVLQKTSQGAYADYYKQFWAYLSAENIDNSWYEGIADPMFNRPDYYQVISDADEVKRAIESVYLDELWADYQERKRDFTPEEYQMVRSIYENRRFQNFVKNYWDARQGVNANFESLVKQADGELVNRPEFVEQLRNVLFEAYRNREERAEALQAYHIPDQSYFYADVELDKAYRLYALYTGDLSGVVADKNFRSAAYREAFAPKTFSERFLDDAKFAFLPEDEKSKLAHFLNREEMLFRIERHLQHIKSVENSELRTKYALNLNALDDGGYGFHQQKYLQQRFLLENGTKMQLGELLEHPQLFAHYPELATTAVEFKKLQGEAPYHFYVDKQKGYVLEIDAELLDYTSLKETLIRGAAFAVQDIEGFDYSLSDDERRNFMDRQVFLAQRSFNDYLITEVRKFLDVYPVGQSVDDFVQFKEMPTALAGLTESRAEDGGDYSKNGFYAEADFDKLEHAVRVYFQDVQNDSERYLRRHAFWALQDLRTRYANRVMAQARQLGGYQAAWLPWGGILSQGAIDDRALIRRMNYTDAERLTEPYWLADDDSFVPDTMATYEEFRAWSDADARWQKQLISHLAEGAYEYATKTINLFETADAETIVHESFHYFWDMLAANDVKNNIHTVEFQEAMDDLRQEFIERYRIEIGDDGKYYAVERRSGKVPPELPRGFRSAGEAADAGVQEMFVGTFLDLMAKKVTPTERLSSAMGFYAAWLNELTGRLRVADNPTSGAGRKILQFLKHHKVKKQ